MNQHSLFPSRDAMDQDFRIFSTTVNIESTGKAGVAQNTLALTTPDNNTFNITGSQDLKLTVTGAVTGQTVDATAFTGKLDVTGTAIADVIKGGSGNDTMHGGDAADVMNKLTGELEELDDVQDVYTNAELPEDME